MESKCNDEYIENIIPIEQDTLQAPGHNSYMATISIIIIILDAKAQGLPVGCHLSNRERERTNIQQLF